MYGWLCLYARRCANQSELAIVRDLLYARPARMSRPNRMWCIDGRLIRPNLLHDDPPHLSMKGMMQPLRTKHEPGYLRLTWIDALGMQVKHSGAYAGEVTFVLLFARVTSGCFP